MALSKTISLSEAKATRRHRLCWQLFRFLARPFVAVALRFTPEKAPDIDAPVLVLANHNTDFDPALVALSFKRQMYFVASEHAFRWGWITRLLGYLFAPMPIVKGGGDLRATMDILRTLRGGKNLCIFAEGNRSVDGVTAAISPATGLLAKSGVDLVTYRLEGGYFTHPRWARSRRKGKMRGAVVGHYTAARLKEMTLEEINQRIQHDLYEDAYARQAVERTAFRGKNLAENLETALYVCPSCGKMDTLKSKDDRLHCPCGLTARYTAYGMLEGRSVPFDTVTKWYAWQLEQVAARVDAPIGSVLLQDPEQHLYEVEPCVGATLLTSGEMRMTAEALLLGEHTFALADIIDMAIVGQMTLTFTLQNGQHYEIKSDAPRSGYKYLNMFDALRRRTAQRR